MDKKINETSDVDTYSKSEYSKMEDDITKEVNSLIKNAENKFNIITRIELNKLKNRVEVIILNKTMHHLHTPIK